MSSSSVNRAPASAQRAIETILASIAARGRSEAGLDLAIETGLLTAWLVRSDEVVMLSERRALTRVLVELFGLEEEVARRVSEAVLALEAAELPGRAELIARAAGRSSGERERLVEALLAVASADGEIHRRELAMIRQIAEALKLSEAAFQTILDRSDAGRDVRGLEVPLADEPITVGRTSGNSIQLPGLSVSRHHARFDPVDGGWVLRDLGSATGTRVDGRKVGSHRLHASDLVQIENFCFRLEPERKRLRLWNENDLLALSVESLSVRVPDRRTRRSRTILDEVSFSCFSGELVAVTGPSGCGKTTLVHSLLGVVPPAGGQVRINGRPCPDLLAPYARRLGLVPQDDIVHAELTVEESLFYSGALRAVPGVGAEEVRIEVDRVVEQLALGRIRRDRIGDPVARGISGGERKRVNLGQELLNPSTEILILDEPTTGLDPHTGLDIFRLLRKLADQGRLVIVVTHRVENATLELMDRLLALGNGGRLAYFGPPAEALPFFGVASVPELFDTLRDPELARGAAERFQEACERRVSGAPAEEAVRPAREKARAGARLSRSLAAGRQWVREVGVQTLRYARVKARDRAATVINFGQIPLIVLGCWVALKNNLTGEGIAGASVPVLPVALPFVLVIAAFWLGCVSAVREIVTEQAIHRRERMGGLGWSAYLLSKIVVLAGVAVLQCALLVATSELLFGLRERHIALAQVAVTLFLVTLAGVGIGLAASTAFRSSEAAVAILPVLVIPQLLFGGVLAPIDEMPPPVVVASYAMASRWGVDGFLHAADPGIDEDGLVDREVCTQITIPGSRAQPCVGSFLASVGLASDPEAKRQPIPYFSVAQIALALAGLAAAGFAVSGSILSRRS